MKRLLFYYPILGLGGAETSSVKLMNAMAARGHEVTLVVETGGGALEDALNPAIRIVHLRPRMAGHRFVAARGPAARIAALPDLFAYGVGRLRALLIAASFRLTRRRYDGAIVLIHRTSTWFCRRAVRADRRLHFIRSDLRKADPTGGVIRMIAREMEEIDAYVCVSGTARQSLVETVPQATSKAVVIYNLLDADRMREKLRTPGSPFPERLPGTPRILTVGRIVDRDKAVFRMARVCARLREEGFHFQWFVVGEGSDRPALEAEIARLGIEDAMVLLGPMGNPFPAYRDADLVAMLSFHEGLCGVVNEAKVAGKAVIATEVSGVREQLTDGVNGLIVENSEEAIMAGMRRLLGEPGLVEKLTNTTYPAALLDDEAKIIAFERLLEPRPNGTGTT